MIAEHMPCVLMIALKVPQWDDICWLQSFSYIKISGSQYKGKHHNLYVTTYVQLKNNLDQALLGSAK